MIKEYDVSAMIASYRPDYKKLIMTVKSMLLQEDVTLQIVVADDGSDEDYFEELESYFSEMDYTDYVLVKNPINQGTVKNCLSGFMKCDGTYVKPISPGDYMVSSTALREWVDFMKENDITVCGSDYICYNNRSDGKMQASIQYLHPHMVGLSGKALRYNYILHDDIFCGVGTLCEKELLLKYVSMLEDKVKYAEDNCYRIMAYCGEKMGYFNRVMVLYEIGTGVSTNKEAKWSALLHKDWVTTDNIMLNMEIEDKKMIKDFKVLIVAKNAGRQKYLQYLKIRGLVLYKLKTKIRPRLSADNLPNDWIRRLGGDCD